MSVLDKWSNSSEPQVLCAQRAAEETTGLWLSPGTIPGAKVTAAIFSSLSLAGKRAGLSSRPTGLGPQSSIQLHPPSCLLHTPALESTPG